MANGVVQPGDLAGVFSDWDTATYTPKGQPHGSNKTACVDGIFSSTAFDENGVEIYSPSFRCEAVNVKDVTHGARLTITAEGFPVEGQDFIVVGKRVNKLGTVYLTLEIV